jgi:aminoglycoside phosphotransferase
MDDHYYRQTIDLQAREIYRLSKALAAALATKKATDREIAEAERYAERLEYMIGGNIDSPEEAQLARTIANTLKMLG